jgi:hypothetical protein
MQDGKLAPEHFINNMDINVLGEKILSKNNILTPTRSTGPVYTLRGHSHGEITNFNRCAKIQ